MACDIGYGKVGANKCENCPLYCPYCGLNNKECQICAENFIQDIKNKGQCVPKEDQDCEVFDDKNFSCQKCKFGAFLDPNKNSDKNKQGCTDCSNVTPGCAFCRAIRPDELIFNNSVEEKYRGIVRCAGCLGGLHVDEKTGACVPSPENCAEFSQGMCQSCLTGYALHD